MGATHVKLPTFGRSCCTTPSALCFWAATALLIYSAGLLLGTMWPTMRHYSDTLVLAAMSGAVLPQLLAEPNVALHPNRPRVSPQCGGDGTLESWHLARRSGPLMGTRNYRRRVGVHRRMADRRQLRRSRNDVRVRAAGASSPRA